MRIRTSEGALDLAICVLSYAGDPFPPKDGSDVSRAPLLLAIGKDEEDDDPDDVRLPRLALELAEGPTLAIPLRRIASARRSGSDLEVTLASGERLRGRAADGSFVGSGALGETTVRLADVESFEVPSPGAADEPRERASEAGE